MTPETASGRTLNWPAIVALALVPLLVVGAFIGLANRDADEEIQAAVVNLDKAVEMDGQPVPLGRQLAAEMLERDGDNISWTLADAPSASAGLKTGEYAAVVTIPEEFSASATSFAANDAEAATQATIRVQVSDNAPVTDAALAQDIARLATNAINETLTEGYLDGIYVGFNTVGEQFSTIVDGARQLSDGTSQLAEGTREAAQGATQLSDGMVQLKDNGPLLADGGNELVIGIGQINDNMPQLADGMGQLASGLTQFSQQTPALMDGVAQLRAGADQLAAGSGELATGASELSAGADQLLPGVAGYADGAAQAIGGVASLRDGLDEMLRGLEQPVDTSGLDQLATGVQNIAAGAGGLSRGLTQVNQTLGAFGSGAAPLPDPVAAIPAQIGQAFQCPVEDPTTCAMLEQTFLAGATAGVDAGFKAGAQTAAATLTTPDPGTGVSLLSGAEQLAEGAAALSAGLEGIDPSAQMGELTEGVRALRDGADAIVVAAQPLVDQAPALGQGATQLNEGIQQLSAGVAQYDDGAEQYAAGMAQFQQQLAPLGSGISQLSDGAGALSTGVDQLADGITQLESGAATYVDGVTQYTAGVSSAADGATSLSDGMVQLADGADELDEGVNTFATELANGADQVPTYSAEDREKLATVVASPVERQDGLISTADVPLVSLILLAGLWLGALASFVAARPVPRNVVAANEPSLLLWARTLWLPLAIVAGQGLVLGFLGGVVLELGIGRTFGLMGLLFALGLSFVFANHALAGWLGNVGRGISVVLLAVTVALGLSSAAGWLSPVAAVSPLHNGLELVRTWLSGGTGEVGLAGVALLMFVIAAVASVMTIVSRRRLRAEQYARAS